VEVVLEVDRMVSDVLSFENVTRFADRGQVGSGFVKINTCVIHGSSFLA